MRRIVYLKLEDTFDDYQSATEYFSTLTQAHKTYDLTIECTHRGVWVTFEAYNWETDD